MARRIPRAGCYNPARFPPFDFQYFTKYLERGLWPFLVSLAASVVMVPVMFAMIFGPLLMSGIAAASLDHRHHGEFPRAMMFSLFAICPVVIFSWHHLQKQLYQLYLARGGEPVPLNPKLNDLPPGLPGTP